MLKLQGLQKHAGTCELQSSLIGLARQVVL